MYNYYYYFKFTPCLPMVIYGLFICSLFLVARPIFLRNLFNITLLCFSIDLQS